MNFEWGSGKIIYQETPWNDKSLNGKSLEILSIDCLEDFLVNLINEFCSQKAKEYYVLISYRISATASDLKMALFLDGFITVEHTLDVISFGLDYNKIEKIAIKFPVEVDILKSDEVIEVEFLAENIFSFGRFYEDPFINRVEASNRSKNWISDLIKQEAKIKVLKKRGVVVGFMAYKISNNKVDLILGGVKANFRHLAYGFWANILLEFRGMSEIKTVISSTNIDVLNLYSYFGFKFTNPRLGMHKHLFR